METLFTVALLAMLQGVTEFLPVSSSGHLVLAQALLGFNTPGVRLEVVLHLGTLISILIYYHATLLQLVRGVLKGERESWQTVGHLALSAIPAVFFYTLLHDKVDSFFEDSRAVGGFLLFTGTVLCLLRWLTCGAGRVTAERALLVGIAQALAVLPGISRSGMTIAVGRMAGIAPDKAAAFSFIMSIPLLIGAALLDVVSVSETPETALSTGTLIFGAAIAAGVGYAAITVLVRLLRTNRFWLFGIYCLLAGGVTLLLCN